jgi:hypothetical protein
MPVDYTLTNDDLTIANGDFVKDESTLQHQSLLIRLKKGELRQYPKTGVGIENYLLDESSGDAYPEIQKQFEADGMTVRSIDVYEDGSVKTQAFYP